MEDLERISNEYSPTIGEMVVPIVGTWRYLLRVDRLDQRNIDEMILKSDKSSNLINRGVVKLTLSIYWKWVLFIICYSSFS